MFLIKPFLSNSYRRWNKLKRNPIDTWDAHCIMHGCLLINAADVVRHKVCQILFELIHALYLLASVNLLVQTLKQKADISLLSRFLSPIFPPKSKSKWGNLQHTPLDTADVQMILQRLSIDKRCGKDTKG